MPAIEVVLIIGAIVLLCGAAGLLAVRLSNPLLRGLGWVGGAFAAGGVGALVLLCVPKIPLNASLALAGTLVLLLFVLLHVAVLEMLERKSLFPKVGAALLGLQGLMYTYMFLVQFTPRLRAVATGLLIGAQAAQTASTMLRQTTRETRIPARFTAAILFVFSGLVTLRAVLLTFGVIGNTSFSHDLLAVTVMIYIAVTLGVGFGLFWMATTILAAGLEHMASTDPLTRIYNRRVFLMWCERELERSQRSEGPFSILMIDLDRFKQINDRYGHATGDEALCAAVEKMQDSVRGIDVLGRWGGEEFSVLLPHASADAALLVAERVRASIARILLPAREARIDEAVEAVRVTASVGVATYQGNGDNVQDMVQRADGCLYRAKATGRNKVVAVAESMPVPVDSLPEMPPALVREPLEVGMGLSRVR